MDKQKVFFMTKKGLDRIKKEYRSLKNLRRAKAKVEPPRITLSEDVNTEYVAYYEDLCLLELRLAKLENMLKNASLIEPPDGRKRNTVQPGATVRVEAEGRQDEFQITGPAEADPAQGKISVESPVGAALLGRKAGEKITLPDFHAAYRILNIAYNMA